MMARVGKFAVGLKEGLTQTFQERRPIVLSNGQTTCDYQVWRVGLGAKESGARRDYMVTRPITYAELAGDRMGSVVYKKFEEVAPARLFPIDHYYLEYTLPGAPFPVRVKLDDPEEVKRCFVALSALSAAKLARLADTRGGDGFRLIARAPGRPIFNFEPEDMVKVPGGVLKTGPALTAFLADLYMAGRISAADFDKVGRGLPAGARAGSLGFEDILPLHTVHRE